MDGCSVSVRKTCLNVEEGVWSKYQIFLLCRRSLDPLNDQLAHVEIRGGGRNLQLSTENSILSHAKLWRRKLYYLWKLLARISLIMRLSPHDRCSV